MRRPGREGRVGKTARVGASSGISGRGSWGPRDPEGRVGTPGTPTLPRLLKRRLKDFGRQGDQNPSAELFGAGGGCARGHGGARGASDVHEDAGNVILPCAFCLSRTSDHDPRTRCRGFSGGGAGVGARPAEVGVTGHGRNRDVPGTSVTSAPDLPARPRPAVPFADMSGKRNSGRDPGGGDVTKTPGTSRLRVRRVPPRVRSEAPARARSTSVHVCVTQVDRAPGGCGGTRTEAGTSRRLPHGLRVS
jgi:hypothetical protein